MSLLLLGPRYHTSGKVGGIVVPFELLAETLSRRDIELRLIDLNKRNYAFRLWGVLQIFFQFIVGLKGATHVSLHGTRNDFILIAPLVVMIAKFCGKHVSLRKFAGGFHKDYDAAHPIARWLIRSTLLRADTVFFETAYLVSAFEHLNPNTYQLRNPRKAPGQLSARTSHEGPVRIVFAGHVSREKGVMELCAATTQLGQSVEVHIYGDLVDPSLKAVIDASPAEYCGRFEPGDAAYVLARYDALVLPTLVIGEGYPGVIIEAFSAALPVIASDVPGIAELIEDGENGLLVPRGDVGALAEALSGLCDMDLGALSAAARASFEPFDNERVTDVFLRHLGLPVGSRASS